MVRYSVLVSMALYKSGLSFSFNPDEVDDIV